MASQYDPAEHAAWLKSRNMTPDQYDAMVKGYARKWREYALCLMYPRNLPDFYLDDHLEADMDFLATEHRLPYELDEELYEATWQRTDHAKCRQ